MNIGRLDRYITLQVWAPASPAVDEDGEPAGAWATLASNVAAGRKDNRGQEQFAQRGLVAVADTVFTIRWRNDVTEQNQLIDDEGTVQEIVSVTRLGRQEGLELYCKAVVG